METTKEIELNIQVHLARKKIAKLWFAGCGIIFVLLLVQTVLGKYEGVEKAVWGWFLPTVMPTLLLMVGVFSAEAMQPTKSNLVADTFVFNLTRGICITYLCTVIFTILVEPFTPFDKYKLLELSNLWLGPLQGLAGICIGVFFVKSHENNQ